MKVVAPNLKSNEEALDVILESISKAGLSTGKDNVGARCCCE